MVAAAPTSGLSGHLTIDLGAIVRNWQALDKVSQGALTAAVLKADSYGLGLAPVARALFAGGARFFFVATPDEGEALRRTLPEAHIFILDGLFPGGTEYYLKHRLMPVLSSVSMLDEWLHICLSRNEALPAALHFDTGMNRLGFRLNEAAVVRERMDRFGYLPQMIMSHLACADLPSHEKNRTQLALFQSVLAQFSGIPASLANSAGLMTGREYHFQLVRPGIALFGGRAVGGRRNPMSQVVKLEAPILQVKEARTGETVGYGAAYTLDRDSRLGIVGLGYADGFFRALSSTNTRPGARIMVRGRAVPVLGRVSMDLFAVDLTELQDNLPVPGEMAEILGQAITVDDHADAAGTIGYEILTSLKGRYTRSYVQAKEA